MVTVTTADEALQLQREYINLKEASDEAKALLDAKKAQIIEAANSIPFTGRLISLKRSTRKGNIDYSSLFSFHNINEQEQNAYRRADITVFSIYINPPIQE